MLAACGPSPEAAAPEPSAPIDPKLHAEMQDVHVTMYMTSWCPVCRKASKWLARNGYQVRELDVEQDAGAARTHRKHNPRGLVPVFDVDGQILHGFSPHFLRHAIREAALDKMH